MERRAMPTMMVHVNDAVIILFIYLLVHAQVVRYRAAGRGAHLFSISVARARVGVMDRRACTSSTPSVPFCFGRGLGTKLDSSRIARSSSRVAFDKELVYRHSLCSPVTIHLVPGLPRTAPGQFRWRDARSGQVIDDPPCDRGSQQLALLP